MQRICSNWTATYPRPFGVDAVLKMRVVVHGYDVWVFLDIQNERQFRDGEWETKGRTGPRQEPGGGAVGSGGG